MQRTIFYSWQSDLLNATNRGFIEKALEDAAKAIKADESMDIEPVVDRDTQGVPGAPDIAKAIFDKIAAADVFVADVSIVTGEHESRPSPNPNVLIELGYALKALGDERLILVCNTAYGKVEQLPFDLRMRRTVTYSMDADTVDRSFERKVLQGKLQGALTAVLSNIKGKNSKQTVKILNGDGSPQPILVTGRQQSVQDVNLTVLSGALRIVNVTQQPVTIAPNRLIIDGKDWPVHRIFFQSRRAGLQPKDHPITVNGNQAEGYMLNFMFPLQQCPEKKSGVLWLQIDQSDELALSVQFY